MSAGNGTLVPGTQMNGRKRSTARIVPAIPLALSKPKAKQTSRTVKDAKVVTPSTVELLAKAEPTQAATGQSAALDSTAVAEEVQSEADVDVAQASRGAENVSAELSSGASGLRDSAAPPPSTSAVAEIPAVEVIKPATSSSDVPQASTTSASPPAVRKPIEKHDMRPIRTELPPAFVPSVEQRALQSTPSSAHPPTQIHMHPTHPSSSSIVFGGQDSTTSSPAPPLSASSFLPPPQHPSFGAGQQTQMAPPSHSHRASEPYVYRDFQPGYHASNLPWNQGPLQSPSFQSQHQNFRYPPREVFTPAEAQQSNGHYSRSRSTSQTSSSRPNIGREYNFPKHKDGAKSISSEPKAAFAPVPLQLRHHHSNSMAPQMPHPDMTSNMENAEALRDHVLSSFAHPMLADCRLHIEEEYEGKQHYTDCHKLILSRSPTLLTLIQNADPSTPSMGRTQVHIPLKGQYLRMRPFLEILRYMYGGLLLPLDQPRHAIGGRESVPNNEQRMENALQHVAIGGWLRLPVVAARGVDVAANLLHWDTISSLLAFALDGGLSQAWTVDDGSEDRSSCSSSDDSSGRGEHTGLPTFDPYATQLLHRMIHFAVHMFPLNFYLDAAATQLTSCPRLPSVSQGHESKPSRSDPRLSKIRFGEVPVENHQRPSIITTTISSMLLSLPFALLKCILEHDVLAMRLGADTVASIMRQVLAEREVRRRKVLKMCPAGHVHDAAEAQLAQNLSWEEIVEPSRQHRAGHRLARRKRGIDTPPSSGAASEGSK